MPVEKEDGVLITYELASDLVELRDQLLGSPTERRERHNRPKVVKWNYLRRGRMLSALTAYDTSGTATAMPGTVKIGQAFTPIAGATPFKVIDLHGYAIAINKTGTFAKADDKESWYPIAGEC